MTNSAPVLPDGLIAMVKRDCATCVMLAPVLSELAATSGLVVYTQDDTEFPAAADWVIDDTSLEVSWHNDVETVPTLLRIVDGVETERIVGWLRDEWRTFTGASDLGADLPEFRPGCGSMSVDPDLAAGLAVKFGGEVLQARRVELASLEDPIEAMFDRGWTDGMPVVPPTEERVMRMLEGTTRDPGESVGLIPPDLAPCTVEKVAINAVMAGCRPEYLPVVLAAVDAALTPEFNMHGLLCTTMPVGPVMIVNGPITKRIGMNAGINVLGQGNRANSTIGRALQLVIRNVGGGRPGEVDRATQGNPSKIGLCFPEDEDGSPWESFSVQQGFAPDESTVTLFPGEGPHMVVDQLSRNPASLTKMLAQSLRTCVSSRSVMAMDAILVISPEHANRYRDAGWSKKDLHDALIAELTIDTDTIVRGAGGIDEGLRPDLAGIQLPKFRPDGGLIIVHAGGGAGLFSSIIAGWVGGDMGSRYVTKAITS